MSAAEKLGALDAKTSGFRPYEELWDALPQIVAVVQAAGRVPLWKLEDEEAQPILDSLAALDEKLGDVT